MDRILFWVVLTLFSVATVSLAIYGLHLYALIFLFRRRATDKRAKQAECIESFRRERPDADWPIVTTQIPVYNEGDVVERIIDAAAAMDYPADKHEIQILDDSNDHSIEIIDAIATRLQARGVDINIIRRGNRSNYKAGALAYGLAIARGKYVAVFDADFVPPKDFLRRTIPLIDADPNLACMQARWGHLNRGESWLTEAQALGIDGHFAIEQGARAWNGLMMNFNGTAGVWRKTAIDDPKVGGWDGDTLTEDLDLSYRAQLAGWRLDYCIDIDCPAELPGNINALKSQQRRWATGSIQVARKLLPSIWRAPISFGSKVEATLHLTHYSVAVWMLLLAIVARPMLIVYAGHEFFNLWFWLAYSTILLSAVAPSLAYGYARYVLEKKWSGFRNIPSMLVLGCGMCVNNTIGVIRGMLLRGGEFVRTPKSGSAGKAKKSSSYGVVQNRMWLLELALGVYSLISFVLYFSEKEHAFSFFLLLYAIGFFAIGWLSKPVRSVRSSTESVASATPTSFLPTAVTAADSASAAS
ncbi:MAG: glycosyltransferase [Planctomycetes bacterium]|nr:glycosyltransferase [Planctomycetota bacterium]